MTSCKTDGNYHTSKLFWALGNYSRFVRPGMKRIEISRNDNVSENDMATGVMVSAFVDTAKDKLVLVAINYSKSNQSINLSLQNFPSKAVRKYKVYETSKDNDLFYKGLVKELYSIPARSIVTLVEE